MRTSMNDTATALFACGRDVMRSIKALLDGIVIPSQAMQFHSGERERRRHPFLIP